MVKTKPQKKPQGSRMDGEDIAEEEGRKVVDRVDGGGW
jgi:hypothetical protein